MTKKFTLHVTIKYPSARHVYASAYFLLPQFALLTRTSFIEQMD